MDTPARGIAVLLIYEASPSLEKVRETIARLRTGKVACLTHRFRAVQTSADTIFEMYEAAVWQSGTILSDWEREKVILS